MHSSLPDTVLLQADSEQWQKQLPATALVCADPSLASGHVQQENMICILEVQTQTDLLLALTDS